MLLFPPTLKSPWALFITCNFSLIDSRCSIVLLLVTPKVFCQYWLTWYKSTWAYTEWNRNLGGGLQKQLTSETEHDKYCKLVMPEIIVIISPVILHTRHVNYFLHSSHRIRVMSNIVWQNNRMNPCCSAYSYGSLKMLVLTDLNYIYEYACKSYIEYENNCRKKYNSVRQLQ